VPWQPLTVLGPVTANSTTGTHVGQEPEVQASWTASHATQVNAGHRRLVTSLCSVSPLLEGCFRVRMRFTPLERFDGAPDFLLAKYLESWLQSAGLHYSQEEAWTLRRRSSRS
jgi:hypothetical protein